MNKYYNVYHAHLNMGYFAKSVINSAVLAVFIVWNIIILKNNVCVLKEKYFPIMDVYRKITVR